MSTTPGEKQALPAQPSSCLRNSSGSSLSTGCRLFHVSVKKLPGPQNCPSLGMSVKRTRLNRALAMTYKCRVQIKVCADQKETGIAHVFSCWMPRWSPRKEFCPSFAFCAQQCQQIDFIVLLLKLSLCTDWQFRFWLMKLENCLAGYCDWDQHFLFLYIFFTSCCLYFLLSYPVIGKNDLLNKFPVRWW